MANVYLSKLKGGSSVNLQASKTVTAGTTQQTFAPDTGYDAMERVVVNPTPSTSITPSSSGTQFSAGLNNMSSGGYAYDSQPSTFPDSLSFPISLDIYETGSASPSVINGGGGFTIPNVIRDAYNYFTLTWNTMNLGNLTVNGRTYGVSGTKLAINKTIELSVSWAPKPYFATLSGCTITLSKT